MLTAQDQALNLCFPTPLYKLVAFLL